MTAPSTAPLSGKRILVTRAREQAHSIIAPLREAGAEVVHHPAIEFGPPSDWNSVDEVIERLSLFEWLVFTSTNGVDWFLERYRQARSQVGRVGNRSRRGSR